MREHERISRFSFYFSLSIESNNFIKIKKKNKKMNLMIAIFKKLNETITKLNLVDVLKMVTCFIFLINILTYSDLKKRNKYILPKKTKKQLDQLLTSMV